MGWGLDHLGLSAAYTQEWSSGLKEKQELFPTLCGWPVAAGSLADPSPLFTLALSLSLWQGVTLKQLWSGDGDLTWRGAE